MSAFILFIVCFPFLKKGNLSLPCHAPPRLVCHTR
jgi:hypothetical protein